MSYRCAHLPFSSILTDSAGLSTQFPFRRDGLFISRLFLHLCPASAEGRPKRRCTRYIPWPVTALNIVKCFHDYPTVKELSAFIFHSNMKGLWDSTVGNTVLHEVNSRLRRIESHTMPGHGIHVGCNYAGSLSPSLEASLASLFPAAPLVLLTSIRGSQTENMAVSHGVPWLSWTPGVPSRCVLHWSTSYRRAAARRGRNS